ncbi:MAG TPA: TlpA disulfide reductase family protein [Chitinophagaceae bacterium]|jgi:peroxiredoxin|nr:TlpA disulfide reductase family protein [Chitinophagaceae bacterium]
MRIIALLLCLPLALGAQKKEAFHLNGTLNLARPAEWVFLSYRSEGGSVTDSVRPASGNFSFRGQLPEPRLATLSLRYPEGPEGGKKREAVQLFLQPGELRFTATDSLEQHTLTGSPAHDAYRQLVAAQAPYQQRLEAGYLKYGELRKAGDTAALQALEAELETIDAEMREKATLPFLQQHAGSYLGFFALRQYAGYDLDPAKIEPLYNGLAPEIRSLPSVKEFGTLIQTAWKTAVGKVAPDFTQADTSGRPVRLSSLRGQYVLVDFWASWCGPCRVENPNVVQAYRQYHDKGFHVLGVSLDRPGQKERWLKAIQDDGLTWTHVSDLKFWNNEAAALYGIQAIPQNLLLDRNGVIIARNLRGAALQQKLKELFGG